MKGVLLLEYFKYIILMTHTALMLTFSMQCLLLEHFYSVVFTRFEYFYCWCSRISLCDAKYEEHTVWLNALDRWNSWGWIRKNFAEPFRAWGESPRVTVSCFHSTHPADITAAAMSCKWWMRFHLNRYMFNSCVRALSTSYTVKPRWSNNM